MPYFRVDTSLTSRYAKRVIRNQADPQDSKYIDTTESDLQYHQRIISLLKTDIAAFAEVTKKNKKNYSGFDEFIDTVTAQSDRLASLLNSEEYIKHFNAMSVEEQQKRNKVIALMIGRLLTIMDNVGLYDNHLKAGATVAVQSVQYMLDSIDAIMKNDNPAAETAHRKSLEFSKQVIVEHNAAMQSRDELSPIECKTYAREMRFFRDFMLSISIIAIILIFASIFTFGIAGIVVGAVLLCGSAYFGSRANNDAYKYSYNQDIVETMEIAFKNKKSEKPENSTENVQSLDKGDSRQSLSILTSPLDQQAVPVAPNAGNTANVILQTPVNHQVIQDDAPHNTKNPS